MGNPASMFGGGKTDEQKALEKAQKRARAEALREKVSAIQEDIGTRTRELLRRFGLGGGGGGGSSPLMR